MKSNPFAQSPQYWRVKFSAPEAAAVQAEDSFAGVALAVSAFEDEKNPQIWWVELLCETVPDMTEVNRRLLILAALHDCVMSKPEIEPVAQADWVSDIARTFPPIRAGRFFVCGTHYSGKAPAGCIELLVNAGAAFGSGEHGTTHGCLMAFEWLANQRQFSNVLDMGCGSGILAIAAAKRLRCKAVAVDLDEVAVRVTKENLKLNQVDAFVRADVSDGYSAELVRKNAPYDLIFSNILARPLIAFAPSLKANLAEGGVAILSGLLDWQENMVMAAHRAQGLRLIRRVAEGEWRTLVIGV